MYFRIKGENYKKVCNEVFNNTAEDLLGIDVFNTYLPMIDFEKLLSTIQPIFIVMNEYGLKFEINSEECYGELLHSTVGSINYNLKLIL